MTFQALSVQMCFQRLWCRPKVKLPWCQNPTGRDGVDPDVIGAQFAGEAAGQPVMPALAEV